MWSCPASAASARPWPACARRAFDAALAARVGAGRATLAMCVGLQVLFETSDESPHAAGIAVFPGRVERFPDSGAGAAVRLEPGQPEPGCRLIEPGYAYFANSYRVLEAPGCAVATAEHGGRFVAALEQGRVLACQFHPELSGAYGQELIARWLEA